ncbi:MAG: tyrosine-protein phosphatase [Sphingomonas sp.]
MNNKRHFCLLAAIFLATPLATAGADQPKAVTATSAEHPRLIPLEGGQNFRDLGGYATAGGRAVRWGLLYRSGSMHFLTPADYAHLAKLGIRTVCDFRDTRERALEPAKWPAGKAPRIFFDDYVLDSSGLGLSGTTAVPTAAQARAAFAKFYPQMLVTFNGQYRRMFGELLAGRVPLAFNCTAGKDRTGIAAALILTALGVPRATVIEDYALSSRYFDPTKVVRSKDASATDWSKIPPDVIKAYLAADPSYIEAVFAVMDRHKGGVDGYLRDELGLTTAKRRILVMRYTR